MVQFDFEKRYQSKGSVTNKLPNLVCFLNKDCFSPTSQEVRSLLPSEQMVLGSWLAGIVTDSWPQCAVISYQLL